MAAAAGCAEHDERHRRAVSFVISVLSAVSRRTKPPWDATGNTDPGHAQSLVATKSAAQRTAIVLRLSRWLSVRRGCRRRACRPSGVRRRASARSQLRPARRRKLDALHRAPLDLQIIEIVIAAGLLGPAAGIRRHASARSHRWLTRRLRRVHVLHRSLHADVNVVFGLRARAGGGPRVHRWFGRCARDGDLRQRLGGRGGRCRLRRCCRAAEDDGTRHRGRAKERVHTEPRGRIVEKKPPVRMTMRRRNTSQWCSQRAEVGHSRSVTLSPRTTADSDPTHDRGL